MLYKSMIPLNYAPGFVDLFRLKTTDNGSPTGLEDQTQREKRKQGFIIKRDKRTIWVGSPPLHPVQEIETT